MSLTEMKAKPAQLIFAGHSHLVALFGDRHCEVPCLRRIDGDREIFVLDGTWPRSDSYWSEILKNSSGADIALMWGGSEHNVCYFFQTAYQFDFLSNYVNKIVPSLQIIPRSRISRRFNELSLDHLAEILSSLTKSGAHSVTVLGTPPPKKDNEALREMLKNEPFFVDWANHIGESVEQIKITLPHVRLKLWYLLQDLLQEAAKKAGARFVSVPRETQDEDGFLLERYWYQDVTHANAAYGEVMLKAILREIHDKS